MSRKRSIHRAARKEFLDTIRYYRDIDPTLAADFLECFEAALSDILQGPLAYPQIGSLTRRKIIQRFPYSVFFNLVGDDVRVIAIAHQSRRPLYWRGRS